MYNKLPWNKEQEYRIRYLEKHGLHEKRWFRNGKPHRAVTTIPLWSCEIVDPEWDDEEGTVEYVSTAIQIQGSITPGDLWDSWTEDKLPSLKFQVILRVTPGTSSTSGSTIPVRAIP